jgi:SAM-dependent methyltransferase
MGLIDGDLGYRLLRRFSGEQSEGRMDGSAYRGRSKLRVLLGDGLLTEVVGRKVIDFGCGEGDEAIELAEAGAAAVIGVDIQEPALEVARRKASITPVSNKLRFVQHADEPADVIVSLDSFEHFDDPGAILDNMARNLRPGGRVLTSFGPTWYHPLGGHLFSVFPWAHLVFGERALLRWRSDFKRDGATRFREVAGGLNQMTIGKFERIVAASRFRIIRMEMVPIRRLAALHNRLTREFLTAIVRCELELRQDAVTTRGTATAT